MEKNLKQLDGLAKENSFSSANNAITCAVIYRTAYSEYLNKYNDVKDILLAIKSVLPKDLDKLINDKLEEKRIDLKSD